ncbi:beta-ketoacyl synthase N-terminal-like domain-containing protein [Archangium lansingense]|uniref:Beta-ketoacyl synthase N-terminal-like domain-containing protein n=1 Tax=Archangium lansingense TaxID=2995310 RepID=A0ABT4ABH7_9BACT|nr:beta-ketoacyl synthase N-terminal-like domain-containing protein [Archangium lansinium]MCY1078995.1 beta-ketoacyl synthase N-terminal-like domain-containing protein [Archangium lansinium]
MEDTLTGAEVAIVGIAGRFPGAKDLDEFWRNICDGVESIVRYTDEELLALGADPALLRMPNFVKAAARLEDCTRFDAGFFGYTPREVELMDPQQRLFLECAWEALEGSGHRGTPDEEILVGVFGGAALSTYLLVNLASNPAVRHTVDPLQLNLGNAGSFLTTRVSYKLDLKGPSFNIESACSTSLVAIHVACQSLLNGECDMALAGGVSINLTQQHGYPYIEGGILSPDGYCRPFDAQAKGIVFGSGAGVVALRRLSDALADGDFIHAVIKGSAVNNDGAHKVGYTAPSVDGQAEVIAEAMGSADVSPETVSYIEAHGTGTSLGDPIEVQALNKVFGGKAAPRRSCAIGSLKANIGHLDAAAGVAGLIKAVLALRHRKLPPNLNFEQPSPHIPWDNGPFYVNTDLKEWPAGSMPRRAGVSSFGMGGTNAHVVLEEAPARNSAPASRATQLLVLSAKTPTALDAMTANLAAQLRARPTTSLADVAYTLQAGRRRFPHRRAVVCDSVPDALDALVGESRARRLLTSTEERTGRPVVFLFPGQGTQYVQMAADVYRGEPVFREQVDACASLLRSHLGFDLRDVLYPKGDAAEAAARLEGTRVAQPALFTVEYALARLWMSWGVEPRAMLGHSLGEYVAACLAGVFSLEDALSLVAARGQLMQELPGGSMLSVALPEAELLPLLSADVSLAAVNAPAFCVVSGPTPAVEALRAQLTDRQVACRVLKTSHAFHSGMMDPILETFTARVRRLTLKAPRLPYVSNVTGTWITPAEATSPKYWATHLRQAVRFAAGLETLLQQPEQVLLEVGPGRALTTFASQLGTVRGINVAGITSVRHPDDTQSDLHVLHSALGKLWMEGVEPNWKRYHRGEARKRLPLPTYPFERRRYWIDPAHVPAVAVAQSATVEVASGAPPANAAPSASPSRHPRPALRTAYVAPRTEQEEAIARILQEVLGIDPVGIHDSFFDLGGHSLLATAVVGRLRDTFGVAVPLQSLFEAPTVSQLAALLGKLGVGSAPREEDPTKEALVRALAALQEQETPVRAPEGPAAVPAAVPTTGRPLKVLILAMEYTPNVAGGVGTYVYELANGLARSGHRVTVLSYTPGEARVVRQDNGVTVHMVPPGKASFAKAAHLTLVQGIRAFNEDLYQYGRARIAEEKPDLLHFHQWHTHEAARRLGRESGVPVIGTSHYISEPAERWWGQQPDPEIIEQERSFYDGSTHVVSVSASMSALIREVYGLPAERLHTIHCAMELEPFMKSRHSAEAFAKLRSTVAGPGDRIVLYTGRLHPMKGIPALFASAERVLAVRPDTVYLLAGGTDSRESTQMVHRLCEQYAPLLGRIKLLGKLPRPQLGLLHRIADVALVPSIYEPFGYTAIETMASGVPIVATDVGGLSEIVQHGEAGLHVPVRPVPGSELREVDVAELASATLSLLNDPARARQLGEASQRRVAELFGLERMIAANIALYRRVLGAP